MNLTIDTLTIRQDAEGRFSLNDLYRASGLNNKHRPSLWLRSNQTQAVITELVRERAEGPNSGLGNAELEARIRASNFSPVNTVRSHGGTGTYVVKELVYTYAMWISPAFHIKVIRTFDAVMTDDFVKPSIQSEKHWFAIRPHWRQIRDLALSGMRYRDIAPLVGRSAGSVSRCVRRMVIVGLVNPVMLYMARFKPATATKLINTNQLCLEWGVQGSLL